jgi:hypothetical protein
MGHPERRDRLAAHAAECDECRRAPLPLEQIVAQLNTAEVEVEAAALSRHTFARLQPELQRRARALAWRRVCVGVVLSLLPLPVVLAYDAYVLSVIYDAVSALLPAAFAAYLVLSYAAMLLLLFALTYAAIPLLVLRGNRSHVAALG